MTTGTYVAVLPTTGTVNVLNMWADANGITLVDDLHVTILYSRKSVNVFSRSDTHHAVPYEFDIFDGNLLVLKLHSNSLDRRHSQLIKAGGTHDFEQYTPHITLAETTMTIDEVRRLPMPHFELYFWREYSEPLRIE